MNKEYLGDGVYIEFDGYGYILTSENGASVLDEIYLDLGIIRNLNEYIGKKVE